ncbi:MAG: hypothetical protein MUO76_07010 [Anaerolineaceae bacterium]|nr:hypothetical protein [Anaerolineaceae bacterium]
MQSDTRDKLMKIGFSQYEAKAYMALLRKNPVTGYELAKLSGVPRSMIYEVMGKLTASGAALTLRTGRTIKYAPISAEEFLDKLLHEQEELIADLKTDLSGFTTTPDLDYVWNIEGHESIMDKAVEMSKQAKDSIYLAILPVTFPALVQSLESAIQRGVRVVIYTTGNLKLPGGRVVVAHMAKETLGQARGLGLILVIDGGEVLIAEWLTADHARASWTSTPLLVFLAEHHLRTDLYLPQILSMLGTKALDIIQEEDRELFASALESRITRH